MAKPTDESLNSYRKKVEDSYTPSDSTLMSVYTAYRREAEEARLSRIQQNKVNFDTYHSRQDFSYKEKGQSQEFLPKVFIAVEQNAANISQALVDWDWFRIYPAPGLSEDNLKIKPYEIQKILTRQLQKTNFMTKMNDLVKLGYLGSLMVAKVHGKFVSKATYNVVSKQQGDGSYKKILQKKENKKWQLEISTVRQQDWRPDPTGSDRYNMQDIYMDWDQLHALAKKPNSGYDMEKVEELKAQSSLMSALQEYEKSRETGQNLHNVNFRHRIKLTEVWGDFVSPDGTLVWENCVAAVVNDLIIVKKPQPIRLWHGTHPYVSCPITTVPHSVWGKTPVDSGSVLNIAINELFNLILDGGLSAVHGIKEVREAWLEDPAQIEDGIPPGTTLRLNTSAPPGANALNRVDMTTIPPEALPVYNFLTQEFAAAMMTNDLRMGVSPQRDVKATQIVEASNAENAMSRSIAQHIESHMIKLLLEKSWLTCAQHMDDFDDGELEALLGAKRASEIKAMGPEEMFAETASSIKFEVFGISETMGRQKEFTKLQAMLQTVVSSPVLMEQFTAKYDFGKLLTEILKSLDVPMYRLEHDELMTPPAAPAGQAQQVPNAQSQIPQAGAAVNQPGTSPQAAAQPGPPQMAVPPSPASRA